MRSTTPSHVLVPPEPSAPACSAHSPEVQHVQILAMGSTLLERLLTAPPEAGHVHSVFARALNILWYDNRLLALHGPGPLAAPFAASLSCLPTAERVLPGAPVRRLNGQILFGALAVAWGGSASVDTRLPPTNEPPGILASVVPPLAILPTGACLSPSHGLRAQRLVAEGIECHKVTSFLEGACGLIGLGEGLTPSGDDFLVGVLAVLHRFDHAWLAAHHPEIRGRIAAAAQKDTTTVGREFILHALEGSFSESVLRLLTAVSGFEARCAAINLRTMGATSGAATLYGIALAIEALQP